MKKLWTVAMAGALTAGLASSAFAQKGPGRNYDPKTEVTVSGTVQEVKTYPARKAGGVAGEHLLLKTPDGVVDVHLGPSDFLKAKGFDAAAGDAIEVTGSKVRVNDADAIIARQVKKGEKSWTLRNASGVPEWSHGRGR